MIINDLRVACDFVVGDSDESPPRTIKDFKLPFFKPTFPCHRIKKFISLACRVAGKAHFF